jgi:hypothetical protein
MLGHVQRRLLRLTALGAAFFGAAFLLVLAFAAGAFLAAAALVVLVAALVALVALVAAAVFFAAGAFFAAAALVVFFAAAGESSFLAAAFFVAAGFAAVLEPASGFASFTGPEAPVKGDYVSNSKVLGGMVKTQRDQGYVLRLAIAGDQCLETRPMTRRIDRWEDVPLGRAKTPDSEPLARARLKREVKVASLTLPSTLLARTYFLRAWRLLGSKL